jgi:hypothetical protein
MPWARNPRPRESIRFPFVLDSGVPGQRLRWRYAVRAGVRRDGPPVCSNWQRLLGSRPF